MDLIGTYLGIWVTRDEIVDIFGLHPASTAKVFILGGGIIGAIPALGLVMRLDTRRRGRRVGGHLPDVAKDRPRRLIRWEYIRAAELFEDKLQIERVTGYHPRAA